MLRSIGLFVLWFTAAVAGQERVSPVPPGSAIELERFTYGRDLPAGPAGVAMLQLDAAVLAHSQGPGPDGWPHSQRGFSDVRVVDSRARQLPYLVECASDPLSSDLTLAPAAATPADLTSSPGHSLSVYRLALPYPHLPGARLAFDTSARVFQRHVRLAIERQADRHRREPWSEEIGSAEWSHADDTARAPRLVLYLPSIDRTDVLLVVDEGDNSPLAIARAVLLLPSCALRFYRPEGEALRLVYGNREATAPQYDLSLIASQVANAPAREIAPGPETRLHDARNTTIVSPRVFWALLTAAVLVLLALTARLVRGARE